MFWVEDGSFKKDFAGGFLGLEVACCALGEGMCYEGLDDALDCSFTVEVLHFVLIDRLGCDIGSC